MDLYCVKVAVATAGGCADVLRIIESEVHSETFDMLNVAQSLVALRRTRTSADLLDGNPSVKKLLQKLKFFGVDVLPAHVQYAKKYAANEAVGMRGCVNERWESERCCCRRRSEVMRSGRLQLVAFLQSLILYRCFYSELLVPNYFILFITILMTRIVVTFGQKCGRVPVHHNCLCFM